MSESSRVVPVEIHGQRYPIRSTLDQQYVERLAAYVDERIRAAADATPTGDSLRLDAGTPIARATVTSPSVPVNSSGSSIAC
jgi:hypothetical protein